MNVVAFLLHALLKPFVTSWPTYGKGCIASGKMATKAKNVCQFATSVFVHDCISNIGTAILCYNVNQKRRGMVVKKLLFPQQTLGTEIQPRESKIADVRNSLPELKDFDRARVQAILERWESAQQQIDNRLVGLVQAEQKLEQFEAGMKDELDWLNRVEKKVEDRVWSTKTDNAEKVMEELTVSWKVYSVYDK